MKKSNIIMSIFAISIGIGMIYFTRQFEFKGLQDIGAGFWPRLVGGLLILLSSILLIQTILAIDDGTKFDFGSIGSKRVILIILTNVLFSFFLYFFGMMIGIIFLVPATITILGEKRKTRMILVTIGISIFVYVVFELMLNVGLPKGKLF